MSFYPFLFFCSNYNIFSYFATLLVFWDKQPEESVFALELIQLRKHRSFTKSALYSTFVVALKSKAPYMA